MKLTKPQLALLREVDAGGNAVDTYPPAKKLVELGYCVREQVGYSDYLRITPAGRAALKEAQE